MTARACPPSAPTACLCCPAARPRSRRARPPTGTTTGRSATPPTWTMGPVITINSATLVNKGLEFLEAHLLSDVDLEEQMRLQNLQALVHQSRRVDCDYRPH